MDERALDRACKEVAAYVSQAAGHITAEQPRDVQHIVLAHAASTVFLVAAHNMARHYAGEMLSTKHPRMVALYRAWGAAMMLWPDQDAMQAAMTRARDAFAAGEEVNPTKAERFDPGNTVGVDYDNIARELAVGTIYAYHGQPPRDDAERIALAILYDLSDRRLGLDDVDDDVRPDIVAHMGDIIRQGMTGSFPRPDRAGDYNAVMRDLRADFKKGA